MSSKILFRGAEAVIGLNKNTITKTRVEKSYRLKELDETLRKRRTKSETKILEKAAKIIDVPELVRGKKNDKFRITMEFLTGEKLSESLEKFSEKKQLEIFKEIGKSVAKLHDSDIIHGDLTTSNMISAGEKDTPNFEKHMEELKKLKLPVKEYIIAGSGPLAIRKMRDSRDLDIVVKEQLWNKIKKKYKPEIHTIDGRKVELIQIKDIEIYKNWLPWIKNIDKMIETPETIKGLPFVKLECVLKWKKSLKRDKDKKDIELIKNYLGKKPKIYFIDFGLGFISTKMEDRAVDIHLLKQALESKHFKNWKVLFENFFKGYKISKNYDKVLERFKKVEARGRYKEQY